MKQALTRDSESMRTNLNSSLAEQDHHLIDKLCVEPAERMFAKTKEKHISKLGTLLAKVKAGSEAGINLRPQGLKKWVKNLSSKTITPAQESVLKLGLNFTPAPKKLPLLDTVASIEGIARRMDPDVGNELRGRVCGAIRNARVPKDNLSKDQRKALKELREMDDITILPADKGNATVLMDKKDYHNKLSAMLNTGTYGKLSKDPTKSRESKLTQMLKGMERTKELPTQLYNRLRPSGSKPPMIYGLPKIHKPDIPLRPIVACIGSPTYNLSKFISSVISPLSGQGDSFVKDSKHFVDEIKDFRLSPDEILVSFDVKSLFTNIPIDEAVRVIFEKMNENEELVSDRTSLTTDRIADLLELCLRSTYFMYQGEFFEQQDGVAMGSPVSATVANLYMEYFEDLALSKATEKPRLWKRYVDDTCCIVKKGTEEGLLQHLNSIRPTIQFTMEVEEKGKISFLDCELHRKEDGRLDVTVHRKATHTDRYLHFDSHHPTHVRRGVVKSLYDRARRVTTSDDNLQREIEHLNKVFYNNGYPNKFVADSARPLARIQQDGSQSEDKGRHTVVIPYSRGLSEDVRRICRRYDIRVAFRSGRSLRSTLARVKDRLPTDLSSGVVYQVPCSCGKVYIGETIRRLETRIKEHKDACRKGETNKSAIAEHVWGLQHPIKWDEVAIIDKSDRMIELRLKEAMHIQLRPSAELFNRDVGLELPSCWITTLKAIRHS